MAAEQACVRSETHALKQCLAFIPQCWKCSDSLKESELYSLETDTANPASSKGKTYRNRSIQKTIHNEASYMDLKRKRTKVPEKGQSFMHSEIACGE